MAGVKRENAMEKILVTLIAVISVGCAGYTYLSLSAAARHIQFTEHYWQAVDREQLIAIANAAIKSHENAQNIGQRWR